MLVPLGATTAGTDAPARVTTDLLVLYTFGEGSGEVVHDTSGLEPALDLVIEDPTKTTWLPEGGLRIDGPTLVASPGAATKVSAAVRAASELTVEAWVRTADLTQTGPARIVTISQGLNHHDLLVGQGVVRSTGDRLETRLRTTSTNNNGNPVLRTPKRSLGPALSHLVLTRDASGVERVYIDGVVAASRTVGGTLDNWNTSYRLGLANAIGASAPWLGEYQMVALYGRALSTSRSARTTQPGPAHPAGTTGAAMTPTDQREPTGVVHPLADER